MNRIDPTTPTYDPEKIMVEIYDDRYLMIVPGDNRFTSSTHFHKMAEMMATQTAADVAVVDKRTGNDQLILAAAVSPLPKLPGYGSRATPPWFVNTGELDFSTPAPAATKDTEHVPFSFGRKPIAEHNAEMYRASLKWDPPVPGKRAIVFQYHEPTQSHVAFLNVQHLPGPGFLNYDGKFEATQVEGKSIILTRADMTAAEFAALPEYDGAKKRPGPDTAKG